MVLTSIVKKHLIEKNISPELITVFPPGSFFLSINPPEPTLLEGENFIITYAGSFNELYPIEEIILAFKMLSSKVRPIQLNLFGNGDNKKRLIRLKKKLYLKNVRIFDPVPKEELSKVYLCSDALIVIERNVKYGFPNKLIDYMLFSKPIIVASETDYSLPEEIFFITRPKASDIVNTIKTLINMGIKKRSELGIRTYMYALENYDMRKNYLRILGPKLNSISK
jgi:glycosyltransferase involved in cell wall biosynthesis